MLRNGIPKEEMSDRIREDCDTLAQMVRRSGSFAQAAMGRDALSEIEEVEYVQLDGEENSNGIDDEPGREFLPRTRERVFIFTTATTCYGIKCSTW